MMLERFFRLYKERHPGPLALALVGPPAIDIAPHPDVVATGPVDEATKWDLLRDALVYVHPSALESFSLVTMEAWTQGRPVVVNGRCEVTARALRPAPAGGCGSPPTPSSRWSWSA